MPLLLDRSIPWGWCAAAGLLVALMVAAHGHAEPPPPLPQGGAEVIRGDGLDGAAFEGGGVASVDTAPVEGVSFERAARVQVQRRPESTWSVQLNVPNTQPIRKGDVLHVGFWARCLDSMTGEGFADIKFELAREPWDQSLHQQVSYTNRWTRFDLPFTAGRDFAPGEAKLSFQFGYDAQVMELGGIEVLDFGPGFDLGTLPATRITYAGHEPDAPWRAAAAERIELLRKGDLTIRVVDAEGNPVPGAAVNVEMTRHAFKFGTAVVAELLANADANPEYARIVEEHFNEVVFENDLKWVNHGTGDPDDLDAALDWLDERGITVRGHVLVWPGWPTLPSDLPSLADKPDELRTRVAERVTDAATAYRGRLADWDVLNEPFNNHDLMDILGDGVMVEWFELARQADPEANLYINDWGILTAGGNDRNHQDTYHRIIGYLIEQGAPLDGIGMQGHFGSTVTAPVRLLEILDRFAAYGKRIKVTELDIVMADEQMRADYMRDFLTVMFSHEAVDGVLQWGFWANRHWKPEAAPYAADWTLKPHGRAWLDLVEGQWWTDETGQTDADGTLTVRGFCGDYAVTAEHDGRRAAARPMLTRDGTAVELVLE